MEEKRIDQGIRLKKLIKALDLDQPAFAKSLGMPQPNISRMVNGGSNISVEVLNRITDKYFQINLHWLLTGNGTMFLNEAENQGPVVNEDPAGYGKGNGGIGSAVGGDGKGSV